MSVRLLGIQTCGLKGKEMAIRRMQLNLVANSMGNFYNVGLEILAYLVSRKILQ